MRSTNCDALFLKGAWKAATGTLVIRPVPPVGWQKYRDQLWHNSRGQFKYTLGSLHLHILHGDILDHLSSADVLVNSANKNLAGPARPNYWMFSSYQGQSVEEVIHRAAGPELLQACQALDFRGDRGIRCPVGSVRTTTGTKTLLPTGHIIHAVAPGWHAVETSAPKLKATWREALRAASEVEANVLVAPALGCGTNRTPFEDAAECALDAFSSWGSSTNYRLEVRLVLHSFEAWKGFTNVAHALLGK
eukprot:TRINITY_DN84914_c0_g1_i1.p1 TRINITY_DN84914_c0_g1~~TRINITY_DN84914_c0_g1_i1.p1  ORF type:complete len:248 (-),score=26.12 TRINITY_DN84914_c0_g1_i1:204-947(-)